MSELQIIPLGGMGHVTQNMFLYMYEDEILIVDCGIGFPDHYMPGVDILIPDIYHLEKLLKGGNKKIVGMVLTHGHDDHIGALPYILPELPDNFPIYGSALTAGFAEKRMEDGDVKRPTTTIQDKKAFQVGQHFKVTAYAITHSVPDTKHFTIETPQGVIYHGTDFKLDKHPVDGVESDYESFKKIGEKGVEIMLLDCLRVERNEWTPSESTTGPAIEKIMAKTKGKYIITSMSSHLHRIQQIINAAKQHGRKVVFVGWSVEKNVEVATKLGHLNIPHGMKVDKYDMGKHKDSELCVIIAGSQGQEGSSLVRAIFGEHRAIQIKETDTVVFSANAIPGNEVNYYQSINELARNDVHMLYPDIMPNLHQSGHASTPEQKKMVELIKPNYLMPIGGDDRHRVKFKEFVAQPLGYQEQQVLLPADGEIIALMGGQIKISPEFQIRLRMVDGKGIGDVGPIVLSDRRTLSEAGIIVVVIPRIKGKLDADKILVVSRGFVFMKEADEVVEFIKKETAKLITKRRKKQVNDYKFKQNLEKHLNRELYKIIKREPMVLPVIYNI